MHPSSLNIVMIIIITIITLILYSVESTLFYVLLSYIKVLSMAHPHWMGPIPNEGSTPMGAGPIQQPVFFVTLNWEYWSSMMMMTKVIEMQVAVILF